MTSSHDSENRRHLGTKQGGRSLDTPHPVVFPIIEVLTRLPATRDREFQIIVVPGIPGTSASKLYICLGDSANPPAYSWVEFIATSAGGPSDATYLVTAAHANLSAEVVVGATPGGELGGTWGTPTVDASHGGGTHAATQAAAEATAAAALAAPHHTVRFAAGVPAGAPTGTEVPIAFDSTAVTGGVYYWTGAAWVKGGTI